MWIKFKKHKTREEYWSERGGEELHFVDGDMKDVHPSLAHHLIKHFPLNFSYVDMPKEETIAPEKPKPVLPLPPLDGSKIRIKFKKHQSRPKYWSQDLHMEDGDIKDVHPFLAHHLIKHFPLNFSCVDVTKDVKQKIFHQKKQTVHVHKEIFPTILLCPSLSISQRLLDTEDTSNGKYIYDLVFVGYAYASRIRFMREFLDQSPDFKILLVGDGWDKQGFKVEVLPTQDEVATMKLCHSSRIIVCLHRDEKENEKMPPKTVHRGYVEAYSGRLVMIDNKRSHHPFEEGEVVFFDSPRDLKEKVEYYLANYEEARKMAGKTKKKAERMFTFKARLTKILNCLRSERYEMKIP